MNYLRNVWYVAAWDHEVAPGAMLARQLLDEPVVLFRDEDGKPHALFNRCPHRFAPLSMGKLSEGRIQCGYHGLTFNSQGHCVHNPHGNGNIPSNTVVKSYPLVERWSLLWIWMGDPKLADATLIPEFAFMDPEHWYVGKAFLEIDANYVLESDNILDLSHIEYLHPNTLASSKAGVGETVVTQEGHTVWSRRVIRNELPSPFLCAASRLPEGELCDRWLDVRWDAPASMYLIANMALAGQPRTPEREVHQAHIFTPAAQNRTYYFYSAGFPKAIPQGQAIADALVESLGPPFINEDKPMVEGVHRSMGAQEFWDLKPISLAVDAPAIRARRVLEQRIAEEQAV